MRIVLAVLLVTLSTACGESPGTDGGTGGGRTGTGGGAGGAGQAFTALPLDADARETTYFAIAVDPAQERVGVAYYKPAGTQTVPGTPDYNLNYLEFNNQTRTVSAIQTVRLMQRKVGLSLVFNPTTKEPIVAYLGGARGFVQGESISWFQSDAAYSQRANGTTWTETIVATDSNQVVCGNPSSDAPGFLVGLWPSIVYDATGKLVYAYRDGHFGQFPQQDWAASDIEVWDGTQGGAMTPRCANPAGNNKQAWGGHLQMIMAESQPVMIYDQMFGTSDTNGQNVVFQRRNTDGTWAASRALLSISNTQTGASIAYDSKEGIGITVIDRAVNILKYTNSADNGEHWSATDDVFGAGSGGWYPSVAMDPINHEPAIAFYICSNKAGINDTACPTDVDELVVAQRIGDNWQQVTVDAEGGWGPKIGFFASGKRFVVYRQPPSVDATTGLKVTNDGALKIAVEN